MDRWVLCTSAERVQKHPDGTLSEAAHGHRTRKEMMWQRRSTRQWAGLRVTGAKGRKYRLIKQTNEHRGLRGSCAFNMRTQRLDQSCFCAVWNSWLKGYLCIPILKQMWHSVSQGPPCAGTLLRCYYSEGRPVTYPVFLLLVTSPEASPASSQGYYPYYLVTHAVSPRDQALNHRPLVLKAHRAPFCYLLPRTQPWIYCCSFTR